MAVREIINKHPKPTAGAVILIAGLALVVLWRAGFTEPAPAIVTKLYYTTDDGQTYFAEDLDRPSPFDHGAEAAYRAYVYRCGHDGTPFVAYLERFDEATLARMQEIAANPSLEMSGNGVAGGVFVKKPGQKDWVPINSAAGSMVVTPDCPAGESGPAHPVFP